MKDETEDRQADDMAPCDMACLDLDGNSVYVMIGGATTCPHGHREDFISIGVRDSDSDDEIISRYEYRELINVDPAEAVRLARFLLDYATDMLDGHNEDDDERSA
jgi:hypothetical protein